VESYCVTVRVTFTLLDVPFESLAVITTAVEVGVLSGDVDCADPDPQLIAVISKARAKAAIKIHCVTFFPFLLLQHKNAAGSNRVKEYADPPNGK